jgi:hypothetical protein
MISNYSSKFDDWKKDASSLPGYRFFISQHTSVEMTFMMSRNLVFLHSVAIRRWHNDGIVIGHSIELLTRIDLIPVVPHVVVDIECLGVA